MRRHNDLGHMCVVSRKGHPVAGQIWIEIDHLNGNVSLFTPAPMASMIDESAERYFQKRFDHVEPATVRERIAREIDFDPDMWVIALELRSGDLGIDVVADS